MTRKNGGSRPGAGRKPSLDPRSDVRTLRLTTDEAAAQDAAAGGREQWTDWVRAALNAAARRRPGHGKRCRRCRRCNQLLRMVDGVVEPHMLPPSPRGGASKECL